MIHHIIALLVPRLIGVTKMDFLKRAERYAEARGDEMWFKNIYTGFRQYNGVTDSVWKTLSYLYSNETADLLEFQ
jgi:hypothetical protein